MQEKQLLIQIFYMQLFTSQNNFVKKYYEGYVFCGC